MKRKRYRAAVASIEEVDPWYDNVKEEVRFSRVTGPDGASFPRDHYIGYGVRFQRLTLSEGDVVSFDARVNTYEEYGNRVEQGVENPGPDYEREMTSSP